MGKCPKCNEKIDYLKNYQSGECLCELSILNDEQQYEEKGFQPDNQVNEYECPECSKVLFTDEEKAIAFLKGK